MWPIDKGEWLRSLARKLHVERQHIAAVGDSINDRHLLTAASLRFFVGNKKPPSIHGLRVKEDGDILRVAQEILEAWSLI